MLNSIAALANQFRELWKHLGINQKVSTIIALLVCVSMISGLLYWSTRPSYRLVFSGMSMSDASKAVDKIEEERIPVKLKDSGRSIYVPAGDVYKVRLLLAKDGLPNDTSSGFELFEQPKFGLTDFAQKVNYQRALQGELERTITAMDGINAASIMLVLPPDKLFASAEEKKSTGSIMLTLSGGMSISALQVNSIKQLIGSSVPGLSASAITITDQHGTLLSHSSDPSEENLTATSDQLEAQERVESILTSKAKTMLDTALGRENSIVKVSANLDFSKIERRKETLDAAGRVIVSETISSESTESPNSIAGGAVGAKQNIPLNNIEAATSEKSVNKTKREDIENRYEVPKGVELIVENGARILNISVSVCVAQGETARTKENITDIEEMVKNAVGFTESDKRTDTIKVVEMKFPEKAVPPKPAMWKSIPIAPIGSFLAAIAILIFIFIASRKVVTGLSIQSSDIGVPVNALAAGHNPSNIETGTAMNFDSMHSEPSIEQVTRIAEQNPTAVAAWITNVSQT